MRYKALVAAMLLCVAHHTGCQADSSDAKLVAAQRLAVKAKMAADEHAINPHGDGTSKFVHGWLCGCVQS